MHGPTRGDDRHGSTDRSEVALVATEGFGLETTSTQVPCQIHQKSTKRAWHARSTQKNTDTSGGVAQGGWSNSLQGGGANRPTGWSESLQWVERIAPAPHRRHRPPERGSGQGKAFSSVKIGFSVSPPIFSLARCRLAHRLHSLPAATADRLVGLSCLRSGRPRSFARGSRAWVGKSTRHPHFHT